VQTPKDLIQLSVKLKKIFPYNHLKKLTNFGILQIPAKISYGALESTVSGHKNFAEDGKRLQKLKAFFTKHNFATQTRHNSSKPKEINFYYFVLN
jgi:hypothetical protein